MRKKRMNLRARKTVHSLYQDMNLITAALLLTGQLTIGGLFVNPAGGFAIPLTGPITGGTRTEGKSGSRAATLMIDVIDIIIVILLLIDQISVRSTFVTAGGTFAVVVSGPIFGLPKIEADLPTRKRFFAHFGEHLTPPDHPSVPKRRKRRGHAWL
ncbi:hypothetical protein ACFQ49_04220 [Kroppenstedtia eburnea]|uniref:hypothetical protein n=1 Tax=Kroppenstedtia eburnea TaxID=714067 RepID=UPI0036397FC0